MYVDRSDVPTQQAAFIMTFFLLGLILHNMTPNIKLSHINAQNGSI